MEESVNVGKPQLVDTHMLSVEWGLLTARVMSIGKQVFICVAPSFDCDKLSREQQSVLNTVTDSWLMPITDAELDSGKWSQVFVHQANRKMTWLMSREDGVLKARLAEVKIENV